MRSLVRRFRWVPAILALVLGAGAAQAAQSPRAYEFDVVWSMFPELTLAKGRFILNEQSDRYLMGLEARAKLTAPPIDWKGYLAAEGARSRDGRKPERFERSSIRPSQKEVVIVSWDAAGKPITAVSRTPLTAAFDRERVDPNNIRDVVDPLTFLMQVMDRVEETNGESCDIAAKTWDGQRLAEIEIATLDKVRHARVDCRIIYNKIEGLRKDTPWRVEEDSTMRVARFEKVGGRWQPKWIRIEATVIGIRTTFTTSIRPAE